MSKLSLVKKRNSILEIINWPPLSLEFSAIELVWDILIGEFEENIPK